MTEPIRSGPSNGLVEAIALHGVLSQLCEQNPHADFTRLVPLQNLLKTISIPWPQLKDLESEIEMVSEGFAPPSILWEDSRLPGLTRDLGIWIVEHYYRPSSLAQVRALKPEFHKAGLGLVLHMYCENERPWLDEEEDGLLKRLFEYWINSLWESDIEGFFEDDEIVTTGQLIAWLRLNSSAVIHPSISSIIEELEHKAK